MSESETTPDKRAPGGIVAYLTVGDGVGAIAFYEKAFDARCVHVHHDESGKRILHAHLKINGGDVYLSDNFPEYNGGVAAAPTPGRATGVTLHVHVADADRVFAQAQAAGARVTVPLDDMFWGERYGRLVDPFGHHWSVAHTIGR